MITNTPYIFVVLFPAMFILSKSPIKPFKLCLAIILGLIAGIILFFVFITPVDRYLEDIRNTSEFLKYDDTHGIVFIIKWIAKFFSDSLAFLLIPSSLLLIIISREMINRTLKMTVSVIFVLYIIYLMVYDFIFNQKNIIESTTFIIMALAIIANLYFVKQKADAVLGVLLISVTFFASLGTDVDYFTRSSLYIMPVLVFISYRTFKDKQMLTLSLIVMLLVFASIRYSTEFLRTPGWYKYVISEQTESIKNGRSNQGIKLDPQRAAKLDELEAIIPPKSQILVSSQSLWGFVYLLNCQTPFLYYYYNESFISEFKRKTDFQSPELFLLESKKTPFPGKMSILEQYTLCDTISLMTDNDLKVFRFRHNAGN